jgi:hypothetical protein
MPPDITPLRHWPDVIFGHYATPLNISAFEYAAISWLMPITIIDASDSATPLPPLLFAIVLAITQATHLRQPAIAHSHFTPLLLSADYAIIDY